MTSRSIPRNSTALSSPKVALILFYLLYTHTTAFAKGGGRGGGGGSSGGSRSGSRSGSRGGIGSGFHGGSGGGDDDENKLSPGAIAGIVIGTGVGVIALVGCLAFVRSRRNKLAEAASQEISA